MPRPFLFWRFMQRSPPALTIPSCSCLSPFSASATAAPHALGPHVARQGSASTRPSCLLLTTLPSCYLVYARFRNHQYSSCRLPRPPSSGPLSSSCNWEKKNPPDLAPCVSQRQRRRLPVTPLPPASYRHRLPQQPANCSATTSLSIGWLRGLTTASLIGCSMPAVLLSVQCLRIPVSKQEKHRFFPAILSSTLTSVRPLMHRCAG